MPVGLVVSAWGGSKIEPWMSTHALRALGGNDVALDIGEEFRGHESSAAARWGEHWKQWWRAQGETQGRQPWSRARLSAVRAGSEVQVTFGDVDGSLVVHNSRDPSAFELCGAVPGSCRYVRAQLGRDASVLLDAREVEAATRVRFCWADSPLCNLYDTAGLPVGPFEIEIK